MQIDLGDIRVSDESTYINDNGKELTVEQLTAGFWLCGFDRDGTCFEMSKISKEWAEEIIYEGDEDDLYIDDVGGGTYYWNENSCDSGILHLH